MITVYNRTQESHEGDKNNYYIGRGSVLGNPFTHIRDKETKAKQIVGSRKEAIDAYSIYFDKMYGEIEEFRNIIDEIYEKYKNGEEIYLECYCKPKACHGDIIVEKLRARLMKEKIKEKNIKKK
jgi:hypothetical protein